MTEISLRGAGHRFLQLIVSLFILLCITFIIGRVMPTDPVGAIVGELADPKAYEAMRARLGLDLPLYQQFFIYLRGLLHGDFGIAILTGNPVTRDLAQAFPATFELATLAIIISTIIGVPLGLAAALFRDTFIDKFARVFALVGHSIPVFWFGIVGLVIFYASLNLVGGPGRVDVFYEGLVEPRTGLMLVDSLLAGETEIFWNALGHIILPAVILAYMAMAYITRMTRAFTLEQLSQDYVIAARAKGVSPARTITRHVLPNIAVQLITVLAISYGNLLEGAVVTEIVFSWPGIGKWMIDSISRRDYPVVQSGLLLIAGLVMIVNLLVDLTYGLINPRIRHK